jgi:uncharacterized protein
MACSVSRENTVSMETIVAELPYQSEEERAAFQGEMLLPRGGFIGVAKQFASSNPELFESLFRKIVTSAMDRSPEAVLQLTLAADKGDACAQRALGTVYKKLGNSAKGCAERTWLYGLAAKQYRRAADGGDAEAQCLLGIMLQSRLGVEKDGREAVRLFRLSADQKNALGQYCLGMAYFFGDGVARDEQECVRFLGLAAEQGIVEAMLNLGYVYEAGSGALQDDKEALRLIRSAAEHGNAEAQHYLGSLYETGRKGLEKDLQTAVFWYQQAAAQGLPEAVVSVRMLAQVKVEA